MREGKERENKNKNESCRVSRGREPISCFFYFVCCKSSAISAVPKSERINWAIRPHLGLLNRRQTKKPREAEEERMQVARQERRDEERVRGGSKRERRR